MRSPHRTAAIRPLPFILLFALSASPASADFIADAKASYTMVGSTTLINTTEAVTKNYGDSKSATANDPYANPARLTATIGGTQLGIAASATVSATVGVEAGAGLMRLRLNGSTGLTRGENGDAAEARLSNLSAKVEWSDAFLVTGNPAHPQPGRPVIIQAFLNLDGAMTSQVLPRALSGVGFSLALRAQDEFKRDLLAMSPPYFGAFATEYQDTRTGDHVSRPAPGVIPLQLTTYEGGIASMHIEMELTGNASSLSDGPVDETGLTASTAFDADFSHTLAWGGITAIKDANTGQPLTDWSVTSASGMNYANPVPEPHALVTLALAALTPLPRHRRPTRA